jgi:hypothetical protein
MTLDDLFDTWSNAGCLGYAIKALELLEYRPEDIQRIINAMKAQFDRTTVKEADRHYCNSDY